jgi:phosphoglycolate phosphatase
MTTLAPPAAWRGQPVNCVLFDLDGTLFDTASDIASALNRVLGEFALEPLPVTEVARMIGRGSPVLVERALAARGLSWGEAQRAAMAQRFLHHYGELEENGEAVAQPYPAVGETLERLHGAGLPIAVVTNKVWRFANALLHRLDYMRFINVVVGGDTCERRKPDPQPLLFACEALGVPSTQALMVGDSVNDVKAARAAGIPVVCVPYGYNEGQDSRTLACDAMIDSLADLPRLLWPG